MTDYTPIICGAHAFMGCNLPIAHWSEIFRCTDCGVAFHRHCAVAHFGDAYKGHAYSMLAVTRLAGTLAENERLKSEIAALHARPTAEVRALLSGETT